VQEVVVVSTTQPSTSGAGRSLLGLRSRPGRLALAVFRIPLVLYQHGAGWLLGRTFLRLVHVGRRTGRPHSMVAMVLAYDRDTGTAVICSAWGRRADWVLNLRARPASRVDIGRSTFVPRHRFLDEAEASAAIEGFLGRHPHRARFIAWVLGWGDLRSEHLRRQFVAGRPFVELAPEPETREGR